MSSLLSRLTTPTASPLTRIRPPTARTIQPTSLWRTTMTRMECRVWSPLTISRLPAVAAACSKMATRTAIGATPLPALLSATQGRGRRRASHRMRLRARAPPRPARMRLRHPPRHTTTRIISHPPTILTIPSPRSSRARCAIFLGRLKVRTFSLSSCVQFPSGHHPITRHASSLAHCLATRTSNPIILTPTHSR